MASAFKCDICGDLRDDCNVVFSINDFSFNEPVKTFDMCKTCYEKLLNLFASIGTNRNYENRFVKFE